ncbi:hypothetical protein FB45DRAFT_904999 [Roridomyces roridus]|uniref:MutL C-terminal dimerisation domain-containing protein n=1 Tax=Roridomyces roridus TaxID=1738132 RepID=A0AAD7C5J1_9AGAR|nr:hypothetical protein FB45DRAFT_904999 [Roridomyces roridus]
MQEPTIEPLPAVTRTKLRSTQILTSLSQVVSELIQNSLDAGARQIDVGVDCEEWMCWVRDDGSGMSKDGMDILGRGLEEGRYGTSKAYAPDSLDDLSTFGFRGEALASCADVCCLEIASRTARARQTWSVIVKGSKTLYNGAAVRWKREAPGTTVCIRDAFYNLPVRRLSHPAAARTLAVIRHEIEAFALVFPSVSFTLENTHSGKDEKDMLLRIPKTASMTAAFRHLYGKALVQHVEDIDETFGDLKLQGFLSLDGAQSKAYQFLYINRHPISPCDLHHAIESKFDSSSFAKHAFDEEGETSLRSSVRRSPRKAEKKPVYVLNLTVPPQQVDNCLEPAKASVHLRDKNAIMTLLSSTIQAFLTRHGFAAPISSKALDRASPSPRKRRKYDFADDSGYAEVSRGPSPEPLYTREETEELLWTDPHTGQIYVVDTRTGNSRPQSEPPPIASGQARQSRTLSRRQAAKADKSAMPEWMQEALEANDIYAATEEKIPHLTHLPAADAERHSCQFADYLRAARGQAYGDSTTASAHRFQKADLLTARVIDQVDRKFIACLMADSSSAVGSSRSVVLIDQHAADERVRVERFLKELCFGYLSNVAAKQEEEGGGFIRLRELTRPVPILLSRHEERQLGDEAIREAFRHWGFHFVDKAEPLGTQLELGVDDGSSSGYSQVFVRCIPEVVGDKLLQDDELRDLVKGVLAKAETDPSFIHHVVEHEDRDEEDEEEEDEFRWLRALRRCPQQLLELVNSKACRGAIMFNDTLTKQQCEKLVAQLCATAFPFQCAHGRPSLVPLIHLGEVGVRSGRLCSWSEFH